MQTAPGFHTVYLALREPPLYYVCTILLLFGAHVIKRHFSHNRQKGALSILGRVTLPLYTPRYTPNGKEVAHITTSKGIIKVNLDGMHAPHTVGNFIELARRGFYESLKFHAHKAGSAILGGCPITRTLGPAQVDAAARGALHGIHPGRGDASYTIRDEHEGKAHNRHELGSIVFAHKSDPNSGSCQFYFSLSEQPEYDTQFVVFGKVFEGIAVVQSLRVGDAILKIEIEHADEDALAEAISHEPPRPDRTAADVFREIQAKQQEARDKNTCAG